MDALQRKIKKLPDSSGIYIFLGKNREILYIGKATSLIDRVRSYFTSDMLETRGPKIKEMMSLIKNISFEKTDSVLEALILEAKYIKKFQPRYNTREKDDKSWNYVVITKEDFPRIFTMRERELNHSSSNIKKKFGPFPNGSQLIVALKIVRKIFPFRGHEKTKGSEEFYKQIALSPDLSHSSAKKEYGKTINKIALLFSGKKNQIIKNIEKEMKKVANREDFELAQKMKRQLFALRHIQDVALLKDTKHFLKARIEAYDVAHTKEIARIGVMVVVEDGEIKKSEYRSFNIVRKSSKGDTGALEEILDRRFSHPEWKYPKIIVVDGGIAQKRTAERTLRSLGIHIPVVAVVKNEKHRPQKLLGNQDTISKYENEILLSNSEAHRFALSRHSHKRGMSFKRG